MRKKKRVGALLLILVLVLTQIYFPGANMQVSADTAAVECAKEGEMLQPQETAKEEQKETEKKEKEIKASDELKQEKDSASEKTEENQEGVSGSAVEKKQTGTKESSASEEENTSEEKKSSEEILSEEKQSSEEKTSTEDSLSQKKDTTGVDAAQDDNSTITSGTDEGDAKVSDESGLAGAKTESLQMAAFKLVNVLDAEEDDENDADGGSGADTEDEEKDPEEPEDPRQYRVGIKALGEDELPVDDITVTMKRSLDGETFTTLDAASDGKYVLDDKDSENTFYVYSFSITADGYLPYEGTEFCFDPECEKDNPYFELDSIEGSFDITVQLSVNPNLYRVQIKAVDENGNPIENPVVSMNWSVDIYGSFSQAAVSPGVYELRKKRDNGDWLYYTFTVAKEGYVSHDGSKFSFRTDWWNPYFDVKADKHFLTITVQMTSVATALDNAKTNAIQQLQNYKRLEDYRQVEQQKIEELISTWTTNINNATNVSSVNWNLEQAKKKLDALKTKIEYEDEEYRARIYFQTDSGQKTYADQYGVVTITNVDSGNFYITRPDGSLYANNEWDAKWRCVYEYEDQDHPGNIAFQVIVGTYGQYAGKFVGKYDATVTLSNLGRAVHFTVRVIDGRVDKLRASVDGKDVSGGTITVMGSEKKTAVIEGRLKGTSRWISIPAHALKYTAGGSTSVLPATAEFRTWGTSGSITYTLDADRSVSVTINIQASIVKPTGVKVICPSKATVGDWNGAFNQYVGIMEGTGAGYYRVEVTPSNASNPGVTWEDLTPDVATFQSTHALGIVPKKAGTAKFRVTCVADSKISTTVTILFQYEKPLKTAEAEKSVYYAKTSDKTIDLNIITNGQKNSAKGASEQRFHWSYSTSGVAKVTDAVHYDKSSVTIPNWFSHTISILGEGTVYVTGTPYDATENCKPVTFKVVVTDAEDLDKAEAERVEKLILAIGKVTLEKKSQIQHARSEFKALTSTQKGLVDDDIYNILVKAELELRRLEREPAGESGGGEAGDGNPPAEGGSGDQPQDGESTGDTGDTGQEGTGASEGADTGETEFAGDTADGAEETGSMENAAEAESKKNNKAVTAADSGDNNAEKPDAANESGTKGTGKSFFEIDIHGVTEGIQQFVNEISPVTKAVVLIGTIVAFVFGFLWRRRQYLKDKKKR